MLLSNVEMYIPFSDIEKNENNVKLLQKLLIGINFELERSSYERFTLKIHSITLENFIDIFSKWEKIK